MARKLAVALHTASPCARGAFLLASYMLHMHQGDIHFTVIPPEVDAPGEIQYCVAYTINVAFLGFDTCKFVFFF
jgi:hypothetical protein